MKILIADDDAISRRMLEMVLVEWGYEVATASDGAEAWQRLAESPPEMAVLDWMMPGMDGPDICRRLRGQPTTTPIYVILLTGKTSKADVVVGLEAGANDYITKPFDRSELRARVQVGRTVVELRSKLAQQIQELEAALVQVKQLQGLLPICSYCKKIRADGNYWQRVEKYFSDRTDVKFSHGICPDCWRDVVQPELQTLRPPDRA